ncbi:MAG: N-acetylmuramoyl-L-alanine amidase-like domain-containing protein [Bacteroidota bacterium]
MQDEFSTVKTGGWKIRHRTAFIIRFIYLIIITNLLGSAAVSQTAPTEDRLICNKIFSYAFEQKLIVKPMGTVMTAIGQKFIGAPYVGGTLDSSTTEHLVVNLRGFDCVTFVENIFALARAIKLNMLTYDAYARQLQMIRYRNGVMNGYSSRLHYFVDWISDNRKKSILTDVTKELGGVAYHKPINFMTEHKESYKQLADDSVYTRLKNIENDISNLPLYYIPKKSIARIESKIQDGDIIAITTGVNGLDISHTGVAIHKKDGSLHLLHAPDKNGAIYITDETLSRHLLAHKSQTGIMVARAIELKN